MSRIDAVFQALKNEKRTGLIVYVTAGCPDIETSYNAVMAMAASGADIIEIGIPFSDPMADGPVIQKAAVKALEAGTTTAKVLGLIKRLRQEITTPLVPMTYINTIMKYGAEKFVHDFSEAGIDGIIVPDLPIEESAVLSGLCREYNIDLIQFVAPTTTEQRVSVISKQASGFIYCISNTGVTGVRQVDYSDIARVIGVVRQETDIPLALGFGIGTPEAACHAAQYVDAVIVGSAVMAQLMDGGVDSAQRLTGAIRAALDGGKLL